jgi:hypothetical protein
MILRLTELRQREASKERRADYGAAIDRLHALAYRLTEAGPVRTVGLPARPAAPVPEPSPAPPQRTSIVLSNDASGCGSCARRSKRPLEVLFWHGS